MYTTLWDKIDDESILQVQYEIYYFITQVLRKFLFIPWLEIAHIEFVCVNQRAIISYMSTSNFIINKHIFRVYFASKFNLDQHYFIYRAAHHVA